jgi:hypothetical protein
MRTIRVEAAVDADLFDARRDWPRIDDAWEWVLARDPTAGTPITEGGQARSFVFEGSHSHGMPNIQVIYVVEDQYITIKSVRFGTPTYSAGNA